jgi:flagellar biosynthetic protein FliO
MSVPPTLASPDEPAVDSADRPDDQERAPQADEPAVATDTPQTTVTLFIERLKQEVEPAWRQLLAKFGPTRLLIGGAVIIVVIVGFLLPGGEHADPFEGPGGAIDLMVKLGAVLALAYVSMAALKRYTAGSVSQRGTILEVLDSTTLGPHRAVYVVRAGDRRLVIGVTQHQITSLGEIGEQTGAEQTSST